jgi:hypothetical protein
MDIRLAASMTATGDDKQEEAKILKLRNTKIDAPLTDHAGNIDLFPVDMKEAIKREKNAEVEKEKKRKERALEDQYTMRFSNAAGKDGLEQPWYAAQQKSANQAGNDIAALEYAGFENKNVWGNEDPRRKERAQARITSSDPFAFMQKAQSQLKRSKEDKKKWAAERNRELSDLRATQEREDRRGRDRKRKNRDDDIESRAPPTAHHEMNKTSSSKHKHRYGNENRSDSWDRSASKKSHPHERRRSRSRSRDHERKSRDKSSSLRRLHDDRSEESNRERRR